MQLDVTDAAATQLKEILAKEDNPDVMIRLYLAGIG